MSRIDDLREMARRRADWKGTNGPEAQRREYAFQRGHWRDVRWFAAVMIALAVAALLLTRHAAGAPVPAHVMKPAPDPIVPGYRWYYRSGEKAVVEVWGWYFTAEEVFELEVTRVEGERVTYRCVSHPKSVWATGSQTKDMVRTEASLYGRPDPEDGRWWFQRGER